MYILHSPSSPHTARFLMLTYPMPILFRSNHSAESLHLPLLDQAATPYSSCLILHQARDSHK